MRALREECTGGKYLNSVEDVWKAMRSAVTQFAGLNWAKIGALGVQIENDLGVSREKSLKS